MSTAYESMAVVTADTALKTLLKHYQTIPKHDRECTLTQCYESAAKNFGFPDLKAMQKSDEILIHVSDLYAALVESTSVKHFFNDSYSQLHWQLGCHIRSYPGQENLAVLGSEHGVICTPFLGNPVPYYPHMEPFYLNQDAHSTYVQFDDWRNFIRTANKNIKIYSANCLDQGIDTSYDELNEIIQDAFNDVSAGTCDELHDNVHFSTDEVENLTDGELRQIALVNHYHNPVEQVYAHLRILAGRG